MKRRTLALLLSAALCIGTLAACDNGGQTEATTPAEPAKSSQAVEPSTKLNKPPQEDQILSDANATKLVDRPAPFTACEVVKRQSNPENKEDVVYVRLTAEQTFLRAERQYRLLYNYYDEGGWILDEATPENEDEWTVTYLDAAGNNIIDDIVWLDRFSEEELRYSSVVGQVDGLWYIHLGAHHSSSVDPWAEGIYDQYRTLIMEMPDEDSGPEVTDVLKNDDGELRFIYDGDRAERTASLVDCYGKTLAQYDLIIKDAEANVCIVMNLSSKLYGVIDADGKLLASVEYENGKLALQAAGIPVDTTPDVTYEEIEIPTTMADSGYKYTHVNGLFVKYDNSRIVSYAPGKSVVLSEIEGATYADVHNTPILSIDTKGQELTRDNCALLAVLDSTGGDLDEGYHFQIYDLNGNCRSPIFYWPWGTPINTLDKEIICYQGRYGVLPQIITNEESKYFRNEWGTTR